MELLTLSGEVTYGQCKAGKADGLEPADGLVILKLELLGAQGWVNLVHRGHPCSFEFCFVLVHVPPWVG